LVSVPGRKSIRRISELVVGRDADQSLQQFVNQSPWSSEQVRRSLAEHVNQALRPTAWVVREVVFPKNGDNSVAVARQYAPPAGRVLNCQLALGLFLAGDNGSCPVNWRLLMPRSWDDDPERRARSRVPEEERSQPRWKYLLDMVDEMIGAWGLPTAPIIVDLDSDGDVRPLLNGLDERGVGYLAQVPARMPLLPASLVERAGGSTRPATVGELAAVAAKHGGLTTVSRRDGATGELSRSQFVITAVSGTTRHAGAAHGRGFRRARHVLAEWRSGQQRPRAVWLTNLGAAGILDIVGLFRARDWANDDVHRLAEESGLRHFEGRSFQGWHHHVTLASVAHGYRLMRTLGQQRRSGQWLRFYE